MSDISSNNKRIAKNNLYLYMRMLMVMVVSLFTVRVVLNALGAEDYGINNVVGGFVTIFAFLTSTLNSASLRFFSYNTPCKPDQKGTPTGVYGATKKHGEENILASGCNYIILRTAWLYSEFGKNFCKTMLNLTATKPALKVVFDQCGTPTYAYDLATAILSAIESLKAIQESITIVMRALQAGMILRK